MGSDPSLVDGSVFRATIPDAHGILLTGKVPAHKSGSIDDAILELAESRTSFTLTEAADAAGVSKRSASAHLSALIEAGKLVGEGLTRNRQFRRA